MKLYCYTEDGETATGAQPLPVNWQNVSNFDLLDDQDLKQYGWLPYVQVSENKEVFVSSTREILEDKVVETVITRDKTPEEIQEQEQFNLQNRWNEIRTQRNNLLKESDIYVLVDRWNSMSVEQQQSWSEYRQALRNLPQSHTNPQEIIFPIKPN